MLWIHYRQMVDHDQLETAETVWQDSSVLDINDTNIVEVNISMV